MTQRHRWLVAYDIRDAKRLINVYKIVQAFGDRLQYSVFLCDLDRLEHKRLQAKLVDVIHHRDDSVVFLDLGIAVKHSDSDVDYLGHKPQLPSAVATIF